MRLSSLVRCGALAVIVAAGASCGDVVRSGDSPLMLSVVSIVPSVVNLNVNAATNDLGTATLAANMKDVLVAPTPNNDVTIAQYRVQYRRTDGRNTPGVDVPFPFDGRGTATVVANGSGVMTFELVRQVAKKEQPLAQITGSNVVSMIAEVTFFGHDQVGNDLSATGSALINFRAGN